MGLRKQINNNNKKKKKNKKRKGMRLILRSTKGK